MGSTIFVFLWDIRQKERRAECQGEQDLYFLTSPDTLSPLLLRMRRRKKMGEQEEQGVLPSILPLDALLVYHAISGNTRAVLCLIHERQTQNGSTRTQTHTKERDVMRRRCHR